MIMWYLGCFIIVTLLCTSKAQNVTSPDDRGPQWGGCINPFDASDDLVRLGKRQTICLVFGDGVNWSRGLNYLRTTFEPTVDEYSRFHIPNSYRDIVQNTGTLLYRNEDENPDISIHVESQRALSFQRLYYKRRGDGRGKIYPYLTAIIDVKDGVVVGITWDDACLFCTSKQCEENTYDYNGLEGTQDTFRQPTKGCYIDETECNVRLSEGRTDCDITLYVVWTGTDPSGNHFQSSASRFSAFPAQELRNRVDVGHNLPSFVNQGE